MKYPVLDVNYNGKEPVLENWDAFLGATFQLITTPVGWLPEAPLAGFDMDELFGYEEHSTEFRDRATELENKIRELDPNANISVVITRDKEDMRYIDIDITYVGKNIFENEVISARLDEDGNIITHFKDIQLGINGL